MGNGILFPNYRPKSAALALIQKERHPRVYRYAETAARSKLGISAQREDLWIQGYQRFGDEFEAVFAGLKGMFNRIQRPARMHNELESELPDPWMLVGKRLTELHPGVQAAWRLFHSHREDVVRLWLREPKPPADLEDIVLWARCDGYYDWEKPDKTWTDVLTKSMMDTRWNVAAIRQVMGYGLTHEEVDEYRRKGLKSPAQFAAHFEDGIPIEYVTAVQ